MTMGYGGIYGKPKFLDTFGAPGGPMSPEMSPLPDVLSQQLPDMAAEKPKLFGKGGKGWQVLGIIGDALQTAGGGRATYMPAMLDMQAKVDEERKWQAQLQQQMELARIKANDPGDDAFTRAMQGAGIQPGTPEFIAMARKRAETLVDPVVNIPLPNGETYIGPRSGMPGIGGVAPAPNAPAPQMPRVTSPDEAMKLPPGSKFLLPDGRIGTVPGGAASNSGVRFP